jgi:hypothetical protein
LGRFWGSGGYQDRGKYLYLVPGMAPAATVEPSAAGGRRQAAAAAGGGGRRGGRRAGPTLAACGWIGLDWIVLWVIPQGTSRNAVMAQQIHPKPIAMASTVVNSLEHFL